MRLNSITFPIRAHSSINELHIRQNQTLVNSGVMLLQVCNTEIMCNSDAFLRSFMIFKGFF